MASVSRPVVTTFLLLLAVVCGLAGHECELPTCHGTPDIRSGIVHRSSQSPIRATVPAVAEASIELPEQAIAAHNLTAPPESTYSERLVGPALPPRAPPALSC